MSDEQNVFILKKVRAIHRSNTGGPGCRGKRACQFVVAEFENKNKKFQTRVLAQKFAEFGKHLPAKVAMSDFLHMVGETYSWEHVSRLRRINHDRDILWLP